MRDLPIPPRFKAESWIPPDPDNNVGLFEIVLPDCLFLLIDLAMLESAFFLLALSGTVGSVGAFGPFDCEETAVAAVLANEPAINAISTPVHILNSYSQKGHFARLLFFKQLVSSPRPME